MKKSLLSVFGLLLFIFTGFIAQAQNYQPFRKGPTYHYIAQDSIYSLRVDSVKVVAGDSVFVFNPIARKGAVATGTACLGGPGVYRYAIHSNNQFGHKMIKKANGDFIFRTTNNKDFLLKTKAPVGTTWTANSDSAITATLLVKTFEPLSQTRNDSVITFLLNNGKTIKLSKNYGFTKTQNIAGYSDPYFKLKDLNFYSLPEKGIGQTISSPFAIYDFQPGDKFAYYEKYETGPMTLNTCSEEWIRTEVLTRRSSPNGDTIYYTMQEEKLSKGYGSTGAPMGWCSVPTATTLHPVRVYPLIVTSHSYPITSALSQGFYAPGLSQHYNGKVSNGIYKKQQYNLRHQMRFVTANYDSCAKAYPYQIDIGSEGGFAVGLGQTYWAFFNMGNQQIKIMEAYIKGTETYGTWVSLGQLLGAKEELNKYPIVKAFPNPFTSELTLTFGETSGKTHLTLRNSLGQLVWEEETVATPNSKVKINLPELKKGLYILQASQNDKTFTNKLVKE